MFKQIIDDLLKLLVSRPEIDSFYKTTPKDLAVSINMIYNILPDDVKKVIISTESKRIFLLFDNKKEFISDRIMYKDELYELYIIPDIIYDDDNLFESILFLILNEIVNIFIIKNAIGKDKSIYLQCKYFILAAMVYLTNIAIDPFKGNGILFEWFEKQQKENRFINDIECFNRVTLDSIKEMEKMVREYGFDDLFDLKAIILGPTDNKDLLFI